MPTDKNAPPPETADFWVFGYGSLMWRPGFAALERRLAVAHGYHRALCVYSHVHRGTPERPGLVLGLDRGGACRGVAFRVAAGARDEVTAYLRGRELVTLVYRETWLRARLDTGESHAMLAYVADRGHPQYAGRLDRAALLRLVRQGAGVSGENPSYIRNTQAHLRGLGIQDDTLEWLAAQLA